MPCGQGYPLYISSSRFLSTILGHELGLMPPFSLSRIVFQLSFYIGPSAESIGGPRPDM